jgi:hypothetical protein
LRTLGSPWEVGLVISIDNIMGCQSLVAQPVDTSGSNVAHNGGLPTTTDVLLNTIWSRARRCDEGVVCTSSLACLRASCWRCDGQCCQQSRCDHSRFAAVEEPRLGNRLAEHSSPEQGAKDNGPFALGLGDDLEYGLAMFLCIAGQPLLVAKSTRPRYRKQVTLSRFSLSSVVTIIVGILVCYYYYMPHTCILSCSFQRRI